MTKANISHTSFKRPIVRRLAIFVAAATVVIGLTSVVPPSQASATVETTGDYGTTYSGTSPTITNTRIFYDGPTFSIPLSANVIAGTITTFSGELSFKLKPGGTNWIVFLCADAADTQCADVSPTGSWVGSNIWPVPANSSFAGFPAYTAFHYVVQLDDGGTGNIHPVLSPSLNPVSLFTQISYTY